MTEECPSCGGELAEVKYREIQVAKPLNCPFRWGDLCTILDEHVCVCYDEGWIKGCPLLEDNDGILVQRIKE